MQGIVNLSQEQRSQLESHRHTLLARIRAVLSVRNISVQSLQVNLMLRYCLGNGCTAKERR